ncbi:MAG TPA: ABC transporter substrate-binding protein [Lachnospiraceae bacterium]|nr:ABC transporter substrate-binding protein [Lachnospiraceae bacterium]
MGVGMRRKRVRTVSLALTAALALGGTPVYGISAKAAEEDLSQYYVEVYDTIKYEDYLAQYSGAPRPEGEITVAGGDYADAEGDVEKAAAYEGRDNVALTPSEGSVTWEVNVPEAGLYQIQMEYYPMEGKNNTIEREVRINGELPFSGAQYLEFSRNWEDEEEVARDARGNDIRPRQVEAPCWMLEWWKDSSGYEREAYSFYLEEGINTLTMESVKEPMAIASITLKQQSAVPSYADYLAQAQAAGAKEAAMGEPVKIQGEDAAYKSDSTLYPVNDRTSPKTEPYDAAKIRMNSIGGSNWNQAGQWITWNVEVPSDGLYEIAVKYKQSIKQGVTVVRSLEIDGEAPFQEAQELRFYYENDWQIAKLGTEEAPYLFYLTAGTHTLTMEAALGSELSDILNDADDCIFELNRAYRQLLMVIGSSPDMMRDYQLDKKTPGALQILAEQYEAVSSLAERVEAYSNGSKGSQSASLDNLIVQLETMSKKPETVAKYWSSFKDNIISLGSWALGMKEQPLQIDYMLVQQPGASLPGSKANFAEKAVHELKAFTASFTEDYESIGDVYEGDSLTIWLLADAASVSSASGSGRDQATVLKNLIDNYFVQESGISANVKLVNRDNLLSATLAGEGPDVALGVASKEPVNYALRNATTDLTQFDDFEEVTGRFMDGSLDMFRYDGGVYALPQTTSFQMMFYRADILEELGLEVPVTWDDFYECLAVIQKNNMNVGIVPDYTSYGMFLYQYGGAYYKEDGTGSGLDSEAAVQAFSQWSGNYADYRMPVTYDFANRFRTGEMPLAIADYTSCSYLSVFAPEIKGLWGFTVVPGHEDADGNVNHSVIAGQTASIILDTSEHKEQAWEFLKWWTSEEIQTSYCIEVENILGVAGRVATANMDALENLPWSNRDMRQLQAQLKWVKVVPEIPGGYFTERHVRNAFYAVYNSKEDPRETLEDYVKTINNEITNKRIEFGLDE